MPFILPHPGGSGASPTPPCPYRCWRPLLCIPGQLQLLPRRLPARFPEPGPDRRPRFHLPAVPLPARQAPQGRGAPAGRGARRAGQRQRAATEPRRDTILLLPVPQGTGEGGLEKAAAAALGRGSGGPFCLAEEVGEAELGHGRGPGSDPDLGPDPNPGSDPDPDPAPRNTWGRSRAILLAGARAPRPRPPGAGSGHVRRDWRHSALKGAAPLGAVLHVGVRGGWDSSGGLRPCWVRDLLKCHGQRWRLPTLAGASGVKAGNFNWNGAGGHTLTALPNARGAKP